ncbi:hypothetical protein BC828DRAFT_401747 [Blastocladiella britannica]|nr:hypothetical protein BC828DRAFT_401747 [Blastocladiella britannica]
MDSSPASSSSSSSSSSAFSSPASPLSAPGAPVLSRHRHHRRSVMQNPLDQILDVEILSDNPRQPQVNRYRLGAVMIPGLNTLSNVGGSNRQAEANGVGSHDQVILKLPLLLPAPLTGSLLLVK